jgi:hypothetical protein
VRLEILDARGELVRAFASDAPPAAVDARRYFTERWIRPPEVPEGSPGHHRFVWDLRYEQPKAAEYEYMIAAVDGEDTPIEPRGPLVSPGRYTVRLTAAGQRLEQGLEVRPDPRVSVPERDYAEKVALEQRIVASMASSSDALESVRAKLKARGGSAGASSPDDPLAVLERDLARTNRVLAALLNQIDASDAPATAVQQGSLTETLQALDAQLARWKQLGS